MITQRIKSPSRRHDLDCLRLIAILILLFFHTGMWFNTWRTQHVKNNETSASFNYWMVWLHFWRMPLLLFHFRYRNLHGVGKREAPVNLPRCDFKYAFHPCGFWNVCNCTSTDFITNISRKIFGYSDFYKTVFNFVPYPKGSFGWHHLWFVIYLLLYSLIAIPFLIYLRSPKSTGFRNFITKTLLSRPAGMLLVKNTAIIILITQVLLRPYFPGRET